MSEEIKLPEPCVICEPCEVRRGGKYVLWDSGDIAFTKHQMLAMYEAGLAAGMEKAAKICQDEALNDPNTESDGDIAYDLAIKHCVDAVAAAIRKEPV